MTATTQATLLIAIVSLPFAGVLLLAMRIWFGGTLTERFVSAVSAGISILTLALIAITMAVAATGNHTVTADAGSWFSVGHYHFPVTFVADELSLPFAALCTLLVGLIGAFSSRYLHREVGYIRFYFLLTLFGAGVELVIFAGSLDLLFFGWEIVGLTSALLIAFFHERKKPVEHGLRAFLTYRACDVGLLTAAVWLHHTAGSSAITAASQSGSWASLKVPAAPGDALIIALLLLWASMGKAAQVPLGGWLPRAMEGPTPSSAIFYGAISIHLGPYLLLRAAPIIAATPVAMIAVVTVGAATAIHATFVGRAQTDIKSVLAYASMTQVGLIFMEIGLGFGTVALIHIIGHAVIRSLQILRSPSLLHDHHHLEQAMGSNLPRTGGHLERLVPDAMQPWLYRHALERGYFDALLKDYLVRPFVNAFRRIDNLDQRWTSWLSAPTGQTRSVPVQSRSPAAVSAQAAPSTTARAHSDRHLKGVRS